MAGKEKYQKSLRDYKCVRCGKGFRASKWNSHNFCGISCSKIKIEPRPCIECKKMFKPKDLKRKNRSPQYCCSVKCSSAVRSRIRGLLSPSWRQTPKNCVICGKEFFVAPFEKETKKTCSKECYYKLKAQEMSGNKSHLWKGGISFEPYGIEFNRQLKREIRERDNFRCQQCFRAQDELYDCNGKKYSLIIHHIDYDKTNNNKSNLISLCRNCHAQTNFDRNDWTNYFQERRVQ